MLPCFVFEEFMVMDVLTKEQRHKNMEKHLKSTMFILMQNFGMKKLSAMLNAI